MNRIILIGNGFDLAHKMNTSYSHFIADLWKNIILDIQKTHYGAPYENSYIKLDKIPERWVSGMEFSSLKQSIEHEGTSLKIKNVILRSLTNKSFVQNWVDVEDEYYTQLKQIFNKQTNLKISKLNSDLIELKKSLVDYLSKVSDDFELNPTGGLFTHELTNKIYSNFRLADFSQEYVTQRLENEYGYISNELEQLENGQIDISQVDQWKIELVNRILNTDHRKELKKIMNSEEAQEYFDLVPDQILFLNFNYTETEQLYSGSNTSERIETEKTIEVRSNHIHGSLFDNDLSSIIFGYGDELDEDYKGIEKLNDNEYLENIKSIKYLETASYRKLLSFIGSDHYQIFIFGHSCGISDRTLLNTLFEHPNCISIKPYYHQIDRVNDNYSDLVRNISRNFNDKVSMRDKVVNKQYCESLK